MTVPKYYPVPHSQLGKEGVFLYNGENHSYWGILTDKMFAKRKVIWQIGNKSSSHYCLDNKDNDFNRLGGEFQYGLPQKEEWFEALEVLEKYLSLV